MLFERRCPGCGVSARRVCDTCSVHLTPGPTVHVEGVETATVLLSYDDHSSRLILAAKNGGRRDLLRWLAVPLAVAVAARAPSIDLVTWVPAHPGQRRVRGYDQGEIVARHLARRLDLRSRSTLRRTAGPSRRGLARTERLEGPEIRARRRLKGTRILLVDDVVTTGSSLRRCAEALRSNGAGQVHAAVIAGSPGMRAPEGDEVGTLDLRAQPGSTIYIGGAPGVRQEATREEPPWR